MFFLNPKAKKQKEREQRIAKRKHERSMNAFYANQSKNTYDWTTHNTDVKAR